MTGRIPLLLAVVFAAAFLNFARAEDQQSKPAPRVNLEETRDRQAAPDATREGVAAQELDDILGVIRRRQPGALEMYCAWLDANPANKPAKKADRDIQADNADLVELAQLQTSDLPAATGAAQSDSSRIGGSVGQASPSKTGTHSSSSSSAKTGSGKSGAMSERQRTLGQLDYFARLVDDARSYAGLALYNAGYDKAFFHGLVRDALAKDSDDHSLAVEAVNLITRVWCEADSLVKTRENLLDVYQDELRRGTVNEGTRLAWSLIRIGASHPDTRLKPGSFRFDSDFAEVGLRHMGSDVFIHLEAADYRNYFRATVDGYRFRSGWPVLFQKPLGWMAATAREMRKAGVTPDRDCEWEIVEAPGGTIALALPEDDAAFAPAAAFYRGRVREVRAIPLSTDAVGISREFTDAAKALHEGIMGDGTIPLPLRQALAPILQGTYLPIDPRDYFDSEFCRRLIEADYLEAQVKTLSPERLHELGQYRNALARLDNGYDRFAVQLDDGELTAVVHQGLDLDTGVNAPVRDAETGETLARYEWRFDDAGGTAFHSPLPSRQLGALSVVEKYSLKTRVRPKGVPDRTEVWHPLLGMLASYGRGDASAAGDAGKWLEAVTLDLQGRRDDTSGPLGWNMPLHVPVRDDQGDPVLIATLNGTVPSPDFSTLAQLNQRRATQDEWLDHAASVFRTPGELALIYQIFFRYCSDSPLPENPHLIGSHYGLSDTHQTVYESLDRRWVGRLIGDCDDMAEFFQNLVDRQGKLGHVMQLPAHAAAGYLDETPDGQFEFVVLQTGPVLRFSGLTRESVVEKAYRHFEDSVGDTQFTMAAVPVLLRFANEETRTAFVLSARIYWDRKYAEDMTRVQEFWHLHTYSAAVGAMEKMLETDREIGNIKELASLYERIGQYDKSAELRREELAEMKDDPQGALSALLDIALLQIAAKDKPLAFAALEEMGALLEKLRKEDPGMYRRAASFRSSWAAALSRLGEPERAWELVRHDVDEAWKRDGKFSDTLLRTLVTMYDRMSIRRDDPGADGVNRKDVRIRFSVRSALAKAFGKGFFSKDDSFNKIASRYYYLGRYGVAVAGRKAGLASLCLDGPYPAGEREHALRDDDLSELDWEWFRTMPRLYLSFALEMLDRDENPELYDPVSARRCLEQVRPATLRGMGLGSNLSGDDAIIKSDLVLSFLNRDLAAFRAVMQTVREKNYASLYDDAAVAVGSYCGLVPLSEFGEWIEEFHRFFPGRQHYFKAAYRAMDKEHYGHAELLARATTRFFADDVVLAGESRALSDAVERLRVVREVVWDDRDWAAVPSRILEPAAVSWTREMVDMVE